MSDIAMDQTSFASGRYSKRKRTQVTYFMDEMDVSDSESDFEAAPAKKRKAVAPKPLPKTRIFPFLDLPGEIKNMIYSYALTDPYGINLVGTFKHRRRTVERVSAELHDNISHGNNWSTARLNGGLREQYEAPATLAPALLLVNKQIYQEARDILYNNEFIFGDSFTLYNFMLNLSPTGAKQLKHLRIKEWCYGRGMKGYNHSCFAALVQATNIKTFRVDRLSGWSRDVKGHASKFYRDAFPWLEAVGAAKRKADAAVDTLDISEDSFDSGYWHQGTYRSVSGEEKRDQVLDELRHLLLVHQKRIMAPPKKKGAKKVAKDIVAHDL
ncbi:hypothetical protein DE146DRAFT_223234 [Phaeosphaeria sp. MPI-PUGE-AT-0046c]|nr:hypothetical protein DE146DRAFT_223234 [Phaeosphaeria sp. MPI-PUGE-AT-0046c]